MTEEFLWVEKYRPQTIDECILRQSLKYTFNAIVAGGEIPNMLLCGPAGTGKTTVARAMCKMLGIDMLFINGSEDSGIEVIRTKIRQFASSVSIMASGKPKVVIIDESDYLNANSTQPALRSFIEEFSSNCRFILTCNFKNRIIEPLHSRCSVYEFQIPNSERPEYAAQFFKRAKYILKQEGVKYDDKALASLVAKYMPDWRRVINELQRYSVSGSIDTGVLIEANDDNIKTLLKTLKDKNFGKMRKWVADNVDVEATTIFRRIYELAAGAMSPESVPQAVLILADYSYKAAFVADHELNIVACMTELMGSINWK